MGLLVRWLINAAALMIAAYLLDGVEVHGVVSALVAAALLGVVNAFIRPVLFVLTLPINILTLGLFTFVLNGSMLLAVSAVVKGFEVRGLWTAIMGGLILSIVSSVMSVLVGDRR